MKKKVILFCVLFLIIIFPLVNAEETDFSKKAYKCYDMQENNEDKNLPACYKKPDKNSSKDVVVDTVKTGKVISIKKVLPSTEEETSSESTSENEQVRTIVWDSAKKEFDVSTKDRLEIYKPLDQNSSRKYTIFTNAASLASRIGVESCSLNTLSVWQIANRVSKIVYEEHVEKLAEKVKILKKKEEQLESKGTKARQHIIKLRTIINVIIKMLNKSYEPEESSLTCEETKCMGDLWKFLYSTRKIELEKTKLGAFIQSLANKKVNKETKSHGL